MVLLVIFLSTCLFMIVLFIRVFLCVITVHGYSMYPTLRPGDRILILRHWPQTWIQKNQIIVGNLSKVLAIQENVGHSNDEFTFDDQIRNNLEIYRAQDTDMDLVNLSAYGQNISFQEDLINIETSSLQLSVLSHDRFVKRVKGLPGEMIYINKNELSEILQKMINEKYGNINELVYKIPPGYCFVRGDGPVSIDSILWGPIPINFIYGIMLAILPRKSLRKPIL